MQTHYYKNKLKNSQKLVTVLHSLLYDQLPNEKLFTLEDVQNHFTFLAKNKPFILKDALSQSQIAKLPSLVEEAFNQLVTDKLGVTEIHASRLEKLVKEMSK